MADKVASLLFKIAADITSLQQGFKQVQKSTSTMKKTFSTLGPIIAAAFSARIVIGFTKEVIKLAGEAEGVEQAFMRLENAEQLIKDLTTATRGTVTQLQLMKYAVQAKNFKIPLDKLATYFEFATKRAAQTGENVDYLVNSIILGLGRGSIKILDNLGLSALELQRISKETGDVSSAAAQLITTELEKMGDVAFTTNQQMASFASTWGNVKTEIGKALIEALAMNEALGDLATTLSTVDWGKTINVLIDGFTGWLRLLERLNPGLLLLVESLRGVRKALGGKILPQKDTAPTNYNTERTKIGGGLSKIYPTVPHSMSFAADEQKRVAGSTPSLSKISGMGAGQFDLSGMISQVEQRASQLATTVKTQVAPAMVELGVVVQQAFAQAVDGMGNFIEGLFAGTLDLEGGFNKILAAFGGFMVQMGKMIAGYGAAMLAFDLAKINPVGAIAAGLALVAIGSAIKGLASRGPAGGGVTMASGGGATGGQIGLTGKIQGRDIVIAYERGSSIKAATT